MRELTRITDEEADRYVTETPNRCPKCRGSDIWAGDQSLDWSEISVEMTCSSCHAQWWDIYRLVAVEGR